MPDEVKNALDAVLIHFGQDGLILFNHLFDRLSTVEQQLGITAGNDATNSNDATVDTTVSRRRNAN